MSPHPYYDHPHPEALPGEVFVSNISPALGKTEELQRLEADAFFSGERPTLQGRSREIGYPVFETADEAVYGHFRAFE